MAIKEYKKGVKVQLSTNFKSTEFDCNGKGCCSKTLTDTKLVEHLQAIRDHFDKPVKIHSSYRCEIHNPKVGGVKSSLHIKGMAADIKVEGVEPAEVAKYAENIGVKGIGLYDTSKDGHFVHIDTRDKKGFWFGHAQEKRTTFGGAPAGNKPAVNNTVLAWQKAAIADGFTLKSGADGIWGKECEAVAKEAVCKKRLTYKYKNLTKIVQAAVDVKVDGKFGNDTKKAVTEWQKRFGLVADGCVGINTWKKILNI